jgi:hypothetical protein
MKKASFDQPGTLMLATIELLKNKDLFEIHSQTKISFYWLKKFLAGAFKNPSVNRVAYLYEHLTGSKLI